MPCCTVSSGNGIPPRRYFLRDSYRLRRRLTLFRDIRFVNTMNPLRSLLALSCTLLMAATVSAADSNLYSIPLKDIDGKDTSLKAYEGKALLIVNVASKCGFTRQYSGLEEVWKKYQGQGTGGAGLSVATTSAARSRGRMTRSSSSAPRSST